jgi:hypothetical protein
MATDKVRLTRTITIIDDEDRHRSVYVRHGGDVTVFNYDRKCRFKIESPVPRRHARSLRGRCRTSFMPR